MQKLQAGLLGLALSVVAMEGAEAAQRLSHAELLKLFPGTYSGVAKDGTRVRIQGWADGSLHGIAEAKHDRGRWTVEGNRLCIKWGFWMSARKRCGAVHSDGPWYVAVKDDGSTRMKFRR